MTSVQKTFTHHQLEKLVVKEVQHVMGNYDQTIVLKTIEKVKNDVF